MVVTWLSQIANHGRLVLLSSAHLEYLVASLSDSR